MDAGEQNTESYAIGYAPLISSQRLRRMKEGDVNVFSFRPGHLTRVTTHQSRYGGNFCQQTILAVSKHLTTYKALVVYCHEPSR